MFGMETAEIDQVGPLHGLINCYLFHAHQTQSPRELTQTTIMKSHQRTELDSILDQPSVAHGSQQLQQQLTPVPRLPYLSTTTIVSFE